MSFKQSQLTANEYSFLTLGAGLTLQPGDSVIFKKPLAERMLVELGSKVTLSDEFKFDFVDGDVALDVVNTITENLHGMSAGDAVELETDGILPTGLPINTVLYVINNNEDDFQLALTEGGAAIEMTALNGGTHTLNKLAKTLKFSNFEITAA